MRYAIRASILLALAMPSLAHADAVDDYVRGQMRRQHIPGLSLAVVKDGEVVKAKGYGLANIETNTPATPETVYHLASVGKQFTATGILLLVQDGKIALDDPVGKHLASTPDAWKEITVRHLLNHTSGIKDHLDELKMRGRDDTTPEKIIELVANQPLNFAPGTDCRYSNTGYVILGHIMSRVCGTSCDAFLAERVFRSLKMEATRRSSLDDIVPNRAGAYVWASGGWRNGPYLNPTLWDNGNGNLLSTVLDLARWDAALRGEGILRADSKRQMWTSPKLNDGKSVPGGFGWAWSESNGRRRIWSSGGRPGAAAYLSRYVDEAVTIILMANCRSERGFATDLPRISVGVARHFLATLGPPRPAAVTIDPARLRDFCGRYEFANNFMLTITREDGKLVEHTASLAGGDWLPTSESTFWSDDLLIEMAFDRDSQGAVTGLTWKSGRGGRKIPRIGPLIRDLEPRSDPDQKRTGGIRSVLRSLAEGGQAVAASADMTTGAKKAFGRNARPDLADVQSFVFLSEESIAGRGVERHGEKVGRVLYYKVTTPNGVRYLLFHMTAEGLFTDLDVVDD